MRSETYTLDSNAVAAILRDDVGIKEHLAQTRRQGHPVLLNAVSYFEVRRGLILPRFRRKFTVFETLVQARGLLPLDLSALDISSSIYQDLRSKGTLLEDADILIAGIAIANNAVLVTRNTRHFARVEGLRLEDWEHV